MLSAPAEHESQGRPAPVERAVRLSWGLVVLGLVVTVWVVVFRSQLADAWSAGRRPGSMVEQPAFVPVVVVLYVVFAGMILTLVPFLLGGHNWARHSLGATVVGIALLALVVGMGVGVRTDPPAVVVVFSVVSLLYDAVLLAHLYHPRTTAFVRDPSVPAEV